MTRFALITVAGVYATAAGVSAQTPPASANANVSIQGCVAPVQRDGTLAPKTGATATPDTAIQEANSTEPTGVFMLMDATSPSRPGRSSYALSGHEKELSTYNGYRVEIAGSIMPKVSTGNAGKEAGDGTQRVRVASVKKIAGSCSATKKK